MAWRGGGEDGYWGKPSAAANAGTGERARRGPRAADASRLAGSAGACEADGDGNLWRRRGRLRRLDEVAPTPR